jgi:Saccharopine dehydrogenase NADP binding domain
MTRIVVLGGYGLAGRAIVAGLVRTTAHEIVVAGRDLTRARAVARGVDGGTGQVTATIGDARRPFEVARLLRPDDLLVVAASAPDALPELAAAAVDGGADYLDLWYSPSVSRAMRAQMGSTSRCVVTQAGMQPGLPGLLGRYLCERVAGAARVHVAAVLRQRWAGSRVTAQTEGEIVEPIEPMVYRGGRWVNGPPRRIPFRGAWGTVRCFPVRLEELEAVVAAHPQLAEAGYWLAPTSGFSSWISSPLHDLATAIGPRAARLAGQLRHAALRALDRPPYGTEVRATAELHGTRQPAAILELSHSDGYAHTAAIVIACIQQMLDPAHWRPGLHRMAEFMDTARGLSDLARLGVQVTTQHVPTSYLSECTP